MSGGFRRAVSMFTVIPVPPDHPARAPIGSPGESPAESSAEVQADPRVGRDRTAPAIRWLPVVGAMGGGLAGLLAAAIVLRTPTAAGLAAVVGVLALAGLSGGLHLDGLADTTDGLASRAPAAKALEIMRRSDIGPFGVVAIVAALLIDVTALDLVISGETAWRAPAALAVAATTARLSAVHASRPGIAAARPDGFGSLVTGTAPTAYLVGLTAATLGLGAVLAVATAANVAGWVMAQAGALVVAMALRRGLIARFGGMTGDIYGALIEVTTALVLIGFALS
ncbi:MAG: cobalamin-5-phosphate synthase CobS [Pseudonocardiales bacterium]|nr:cobalamin-5-phosphate synthase CobS [Pseudonocardiales bacterium]